MTAFLTETPYSWQTALCLPLRLLGDPAWRDFWQPCRKAFPVFQGQDLKIRNIGSIPIQVFSRSMKIAKSTSCPWSWAGPGSGRCSPPANGGGWPGWRVWSRRKASIREVGDTEKPSPNSCSNAITLRTLLLFLKQDQKCHRAAQQAALAYLALRERNLNSFLRRSHASTICSTEAFPVFAALSTTRKGRTPKK